MLATLDIKKPINVNGKAIEPDVQFKNAIFRYVSQLPKQKWGIESLIKPNLFSTPTDFKVDIVPRVNSKAALATSTPMASTF